MKVTYEFGHDEEERQRIFSMALDMHSALWELDRSMRDEEKSDEPPRKADYWRSRLHAIMESRGVLLYD